MKYIKTYERIVTLDLDDSDLRKMITQAIYSQPNKISLIKSILESGYDPNNYEARSFLFRIVTMDRDTSSVINEYLKMMSLFIEHGADLNDAGFDGDLLTAIVEDSSEDINGIRTLKDGANYLRRRKEYIRFLIKAGSDLSNKDFSFFKSLEALKKKRNIGKTAEDILNMAIEEKPEAYEKYLISKDIKKFNL